MTEQEKTANSVVARQDHHIDTEPQTRLHQEACMELQLSCGIFGLLAGL